MVRTKQHKFIGQITSFWFVTDIKRVHRETLHSTETSFNLKEDVSNVTTVGDSSRLPIRALLTARANSWSPSTTVTTQYSISAKNTNLFKLNFLLLKDLLNFPNRTKSIVHCAN